MYKKSISFINVRTGITQVNNSNTLDVTPNADLNIAASQLGGNIKIGNAKTSGSIYLGNTGNTDNSVVMNAPLITAGITTSGILNLGPTSIIHLNSSSGTANQYLASQGTSMPIWKDMPALELELNWVGTAASDLNMNGYDITCNTISSLTSNGEVEICAEQTSGNLNIGTGLRTGQINIGTGSVNPITIGGESSSIALNGTCTFAKQIIASGIQTLNTTADLNIADSQLSGDIKIGNAKTSGSIYLGNTGNTGNSVVINAPLTCGLVTVGTKITSSKYDSTDATTAMTVGSNLTSSLTIGGTGTISLGAGQTTEVLNIGTGTRNIGDNGGGINIGINAIGAIPIVIGNDVTNTSLPGTVTLGTTGITTTNMGNLAMGSTGTIFTTSGQQIRLGHAHTQASGGTSSSYGPFFKSFGPATVTGTTYDILYEGPDGLFTPTGLICVGGFLTIVISNKTAKIATLTYNVANRAEVIGFNSLTAMTNVFGGWTTNPTIGAGTGNNIRITFNEADWSSTKVSWMFMGSI